LNFKNILDRKIFEISHQNLLRRLGCSRRRRAFNASIRFFEAIPLVNLGVAARALTPKRPRSPAQDVIGRALGSKRPRASVAPEASKASNFDSTIEIQPEGANWTFKGRLAKLGGELKGNPFKAVVDLVDHDKLQLKKRDVSARGMAEEMLTMHFLVRIPTLG
jgi:hypothetical protein